MKKITWKDRLAYRFDNFMSRGTIALVGGLAGATLIFILGVTLVAWGLRLSPDMSFLALLWTNLLQALAPNPVDVSAGPWLFLLSMLITTLGGIFFVSIFIGVLTTGIEGRIQMLRKGRSRVLESNHTIILGWSAQVFTIVQQLVLANANQPKSCIVILGNKDKVEMEDEIRTKVGNTGKTRVVCRTGDPFDIADLDLVSLNTSKSVIVISPETDNPDSSVIKTILAITRHPNRRPAPYHIVAEIFDAHTAEVARLVGKEEVELVLVSGLIARVIAQTCRQSGLSVVYTELFNFEGDEIYMTEEPALVGKTFGDALAAFEDSALIGLEQQGRTPSFNPPMDTCIQPGDRLVVISEDDDAIRLSGLSRTPVQIDLIQSTVMFPVRPERTLILGWNQRAPLIIQELDAYVAVGSELRVVADFEGEEILRSQVGENLKNQKVSFQRAVTTDRYVLDHLQVDTYDHIIILCYSDDHDVQEADAHTLVTLLHLRDIADKGGGHFSITSEMMDVRNRHLADVTRADDFIVSNEMVSLMLAQVSENKSLNAIFTDILDPEGSEVYLKPAFHYVQPGKPVSFYTVLEAARRRGEVAFGYRIAAQSQDEGMSYGIHVNPDKSSQVVFTENDKVIVAAES